MARNRLDSTSDIGRAETSAGGPPGAPVVAGAGVASPVLSRRWFLALTGAGTLGLFVRGPGGPRLAYAVAVGPTLDPTGIPKFTTPLLIPPAMPRAGKIKVKGGKNIDYYEIAMRQFAQQILPTVDGAGAATGLNPTTVWGYGPAKAQGGPVIFNAPSLTIEAKFNTPVRVKWINDLTTAPGTAQGKFLRHLLPVDPTLHWANPPGGISGRDTRPDYTGQPTPDPYTGPVPIVTHVHGAVGVGDESDGYTEAWFLPVATDIPGGYATEGTWYDFFKGKAATAFGVTWAPGSATFQYPNNQRASTLWYHDHALGMTRLNVYAGPAGFFIIRGGPSDKVLDTAGQPAVLPGPAPAIGDPAGMTYYEIPLAIQDRSFNADGSLFYPDSREFFDDVAGPYIPESDIAPIWNPEFFGNTLIVNGNTWPTLTVEQRRYRLRFLNGCQSRFLILDFSHDPTKDPEGFGVPGAEVWQIGNEGGFLATPVDHTATGTVLLGPAERADIIVDFTNVPLGTHILKNIGPDEPFGGGEAGVDFPVADPATTGQVMQFDVVPTTAPDTSTPPAQLVLPAVAALPPETVTRRLALIEKMDADLDAPIEALLGTVDNEGTWSPAKWMEPVTEKPHVGDTEVWEFYNTTGDAHPMHIHEVVFEVVNRQDVVVDEMDQKVAVLEGSTPTLPEPWETGFKDTVIAYPGQVTRVRATFTNPGQYVWHCHIVEHEDNEMMRPFRIGLDDNYGPPPPPAPMS